VRVVALTGGIGSGKTTVGEYLARRGARVIEADLVVKELQQPGQPVFNSMVERWGDRIVAEDGTLDRPAVAEIVFADDTERVALGLLIHPAVRDEMISQATEEADTDRVVILDIPLLAEGGVDQWGVGAVIVVDTPVDVAVKRLIEWRGFTQKDAEARVAAQATREQRLELADMVIDNSHDLDHLEAEIERCHEWLSTLKATTWPPRSTPRVAEPGS